MLREFLEVVNRTPLQPRQDLESVVEAWEAEIAKLKGSEKENKNSNNEDAASEHLTEEKAAK